MTLVVLWHSDEINLYVLKPSQSIKCSGPSFQINDQKYIKLPIKGQYMRGCGRLLPLLQKCSTGTLDLSAIVNPNLLEQRSRRVLLFQMQ